MEFLILFEFAHKFRDRPRLPGANAILIPREEGPLMPKPSVYFLQIASYSVGSDYYIPRRQIVFALNK